MRARGTRFRMRSRSSCKKDPAAVTATDIYVAVPVSFTAPAVWSALVDHLVELSAWPNYIVVDKDGFDSCVRWAAVAGYWRSDRLRQLMI